QDTRVRYLRSEVNWGAAWSHNIVVQLARGRYFKWAAADDLCAPRFVAACLEVLAADPTVVLVLPGVIEIDQQGQDIGRWEHSLRVDHPSPHVRFHDFACVWNDCLHFFGLIRASVLRRTGLVGSFIESDNVTLSELALHGPFHDLHEPLFLHRNHPHQSIRAMESRYERAAWFDPRMSRRLLFPEWRLGREHLRALQRAPLSHAERLRCYAQILPWLWWRKGSLVEDLRWARHTAEPVRPGRFAATVEEAS
ncbi:MAG: glycosyltransferase, partial [Actinomycetota bacterium]|nr:glycosyltransferase [Actinomycetota bacterium]